MEEKAKRLQRAIRWYAVSALIIVGLIIAGIVILPLRARLFDFQKSHLAFSRDMAILVISETMHPLQNIANQLAARADVRDILREYNDGKIKKSQAHAKLSELTSETLASNPDLIALMRFDRNRTLIASRGKISLPLASLSTLLTDKTIVQGPFFEKNNHYMLIAAPIFSQMHQLLGYTVCAFRLQKLEDMMNQSMQSKLGKAFVFYAKDHQVHWFSMSHIHPKTQELLTNDTQLNSILLNALQKNISGVDSNTFDHVGLVVAYAPIPDLSWGVAIVADRLDLYHSIQNVVMVLFAIATSILILFAFGLNAVLRPLSSQLLFRDAELKTLVEKSQEKLKFLNERLYGLAMYDSLTQLLTRTAFYARAEAELSRCQRLKKSCALLFIDLDHFKSINDRFGHNAGDIFLKEFAARLSKTIRKEDTVARLGGDEFVLLISEGSQDFSVDNVLARVSQVTLEPIQLPDHAEKVNMSVGVAIYPHDGEKLDELLCVADQRMYAVKLNKK